MPVLMLSSSRVLNWFEGAGHVLISFMVSLRVFCDHKTLRGKPADLEVNGWRIPYSCRWTANTWPLVNKMWIVSRLLYFTGFLLLQWTVYKVRPESLEPADRWIRLQAHAPSRWWPWLQQWNHCRVVSDLGYGAHQQWGVISVHPRKTHFTSPNSNDHLVLHYWSGAFKHRTAVY